MRAFGLAAIVVALFIGSLLVLVTIRPSPADHPAAGTTAASGPATMAATDFTLTSTSVELPADDALFPPGPNVDLVNQRCLACHSASMALFQPALKPEQWRAIVEKMRDTYHAPIAPGDVQPIVNYFAARTVSSATVADAAAPATALAAAP